MAVIWGNIQQMCYVRLYGCRRAHACWRRPPTGHLRCPLNMNGRHSGGISVTPHASVNGSASGGHGETCLRRNSPDGWGVFQGEKSRPIWAAGLNLLDDRGPDVKVNPINSPECGTRPALQCRTLLISIGAWDQSGVKRAVGPNVLYCVVGIVCW